MGEMAVSSDKLMRTTLVKSNVYHIRCEPRCEHFAVDLMIFFEFKGKLQLHTRLNIHLYMLSVIIITKNEAYHLRRCLESVQWADEIIVVDSGSEDSTVAIAREFTPHVFSMVDWLGYGIQKQRALEKATGDWVLNLDADESVPEQLKAEIQRAMSQQTAFGYRIPIRMNFYGKLLRYSSSPSRHIRLFKREGARYSDDIVHEKIMLPPGVNVLQCVSPIMHHSFRDVSHALYKINHYSSSSAKIRNDKKISTNLVKIISGTAWMFCRCYVLQRGFMDGKAGFLMACFNAQGTFYRGVKQLYQDKS